MKTLTVTFFLLASIALSAQNQGNIWYFGEGVGLDFNSGTPVVLDDGEIFGDPDGPDEFLYSEGCSTVSDNLGSLLFYSNGEQVWNRDHEVMPNGDDLMGMYSSTSAALIIPVPDNDSLFFVFTTDGLERDLENGLRYSVVDMCMEEGMGDVIADQKNIPLLDNAAEKLAAVKHENNKDVWLIAHEHGTDAFYTYLITNEGIDTTIITNIGSVHEGTGFYSAIGQMKASSDGNKIALVVGNVYPAILEVFDFDASTGVISNAMSLDTDNGEYGLEFSPDGGKLYTQNFSGIQQYDLFAGTVDDINASKTNVSNSACVPGGMQLGPDGRIYVNRCSNNVSIIETPNLSGEDCSFNEDGIDFSPNQARVSFPSFIAGFAYTNKLPQCYEPTDPKEEEEEEEEEETEDTTTVNIQEASLTAWMVYPNPVFDQILIETNNQSFNILISHIGGQLILNENFTETDKVAINVSSLESGMYIYTIIVDGQKIKTGTFIKQE